MFFGDGGGGVWFRVHCLGFRGWGLGFRVRGFRGFGVGRFRGFGVLGKGLRFGDFGVRRLRVGGLGVVVHWAKDFRALSLNVFECRLGKDRISQDDDPDK